MKQDIIYFLEKREQNELMSRKHKTGCATLNYIEHFLILAFKITDVFQFSIGITSSAIGLKICAIVAGIEKHNRRACSGGVQGVRTPALFCYNPNCVLKFLDQFRKNTLKNQV